MKVGLDSVVQRRAKASSGAGDTLKDPLATPGGSSVGLSDPLRSGLEGLSGFDMGDVRVHRDSDAPARVGAAAFTQGSDIHLGAGQEQYLPHEGWHVVQQKEGRVGATTQFKGAALNEDAALEAEADEMGARAAQGARGTGGLQHAAPRAAAPVQRVVQLGGKYDAVFDKAEDDAVVNMDYTYGSVSDDDYVEAVDELIAEHLAAGFTGSDAKDVKVPKATPDKKGWGGAEGVLYVPERTKGLNLMMGNNTFVPSLTHELGHFAVGGKGTHSGMEDAIGKIAAKAGVEAEKPDYKEVAPKKAAWIEESRADLTGVYLRKTRDKAVPALKEYEAQLDEEPADGEHPPGEVRIALIKEYLATLKD